MLKALIQIHQILKLVEKVIHIFFICTCICVQYCGGAQHRGGVQYCGGYHEYHGGYLEYRGVFSTVRDIMINVGIS